jgi:hypothetical protein
MMPAMIMPIKMTVKNPFTTGNEGEKKIKLSVGL